MLHSLFASPCIKPYILPNPQTNLTVTGLTACVLLYTKSSGVLYFCVGGVACSMSVKLIKRFIRQPRPAHPSQHKISYGCDFILRYNRQVDFYFASHNQHAQHAFRDNHLLRVIHPPRMLLSPNPHLTSPRKHDPNPSPINCRAVGRPYSSVACLAGAPHVAPSYRRVFLRARLRFHMVCAVDEWTR